MVFDSTYKNKVLDNRAELISIIETIIFLRPLRGDNDSEPILSNSVDNNDGNLRFLV